MIWKKRVIHGSVSDMANLRYVLIIRVLITWTLVCAYVCFVQGEGSIEYIRLDMTFIDHTYNTVTAQSVVKCCGACSADTRCASVSFAAQTDTCLLNDLESDNVSAGFVSYSTTWASYVKKVLDPCPTPPWILYGRHCYLVIADKLVWFDVESLCQAFNSHLIDIQDADESNFVVGATRTAVSFWECWIGLYRSLPSGMLVYSNNASLTYTNYASGEPSEFEYSVPSDCFVVNDVEEWNDIPCLHRRVATPPTCLMRTVMLRISSDI